MPNYLASECPLSPDEQAKLPTIKMLEGVVAEVERLGGPTLSIWTVRKAVYDCELPYCLIAGMRYFAPADVKAWLLGMVSR